MLATPGSLTGWNFFEDLEEVPATPGIATTSGESEVDTLDKPSSAGEAGDPYVLEPLTVNVPRKTAEPTPEPDSTMLDSTGFVALGVALYILTR